MTPRVRHDDDDRSPVRATPGVGELLQDESAAAGRCDQCGRAVGETTHRRASYAVAGYRLHTGATEPAVVRKPDSDAIAFTYQRLVHPVLLVTCATCYADPARRARHQRWDFPLT
jgi:hypothetical protein